MLISNSKSKKTSKFIREYGMTLEEMSNKYGYTINYLWILHQRGELHQFIEEQEKQHSEASCK